MRFPHHVQCVLHRIPWRTNERVARVRESGRARGGRGQHSTFYVLEQHLDHVLPLVIVLRTSERANGRTGEARSASETGRLVWACGRTSVHVNTHIVMEEHLVDRRALSDGILLGRQRPVEQTRPPATGRRRRRRRHRDDATARVIAGGVVGDTRIGQRRQRQRQRGRDHSLLIAARNKFEADTRIGRRQRQRGRDGDHSLLIARNKFEARRSPGTSGTHRHIHGRVNPHVDAFAFDRIQFQLNVFKRTGSSLAFWSHEKPRLKNTSCCCSSSSSSWV